MSLHAPAAGPMSLHAPVAGAMSASFPAAGPMSTNRPDAQPLFGSASNSLSAVGTGPATRLLWQNTTTGDRSIWYMDGTSWNGSYVALPRVPTEWSIAGSGDFNGDGQADIVWQNTTTGDRSIWFMSGTTWGGTYALLPNVPTQWSIAGVGDFNADGKPDIVWQNTTTGDRSIWFMNGSTWGGTYALLPRVTTDWSIAGVGDFNGDGKPDLVWQNTTTGQRSIWFMNGSTWDGTYSLLQTVPTDWRIAGVADFDGDAKPDLVWQNLTSGQRSIWLMNGSVWNGSYTLLPTVPTQWSIAGALAPASLINGRTYSGTISVPGQLDTWTFTATQGDYIALSMGTVAPASAHFAPWIRLVSPTGVLLGNSQRDQGAGNIAATAPTSGTYTVIVGSSLSGFGDGTGSYLLTLAKGPGTVVVSSGDEGGPMADGATNAGTIYLGDFDTWTFTATQGDYIALSMGTAGSTSAHFAPWIRLVSPTGELLGNSQRDQGAGNIAATAPTSGTYTVIVGSYLSGFYDGTGSYLLTLAKGPGTVVVSSGDEGGPMADGATNAGTIYLGDFDTWTFTATQGDYIALSMGTAGSTSAHFAPWIRLVSPTGVLLGNSSTGTGASNIAATAPVSGTYTVIVGSYLSGFYDGTGSYLLTLAKGPGTVVVSSGDEGGPMADGATNAGTIYLGDFDTWTFTATQGDYIALSMGTVTPASAHFAPWIRLVSPTGVLLGNSSTGQGAGNINATAPTSGTYTVIVGSYSSGFYDGTGSYLLTLAKGPGTVVVSSGDEGGPMADGDNAGTIYLGDFDTWTFTATQGQVVTLSMGTVTPASAHFAPWIRLVSPTGALLGNISPGTATAQMTVTMPANGTYTVIVGSYSSGFFDGTGSYLLNLAR